MTLNNAEEAAIEDRRQKAWQLRVAGKTYREIAKATGVSTGTAFTDITTVLHRIKAENDETAEHHRAMQLDRLDEAIAVVMPMLRSKDKKLALEAVDRLDRIERRRAALLGLDEPTKVKGVLDANLTATVATPAAAARLIREAFGDKVTSNGPAEVSEPGSVQQDPDRG